MAVLKPKKIKKIGSAPMKQKTSATKSAVKSSTKSTLSVKTSRSGNKVAQQNGVAVIQFRKSKGKKGKGLIGLGNLSKADQKGMSGSASSALKYYNKHIRGKKH